VRRAVGAGVSTLVGHTADKREVHLLTFGPGPYPPHVSNKHASRMLALAVEVAVWSSCPEGKQHGCIMAVDGKYVVATGYNGVSRSAEACGTCCYDHFQAGCGAVHAEVNAVINAARVGAQLGRCFAFVTKRPCEPCQRVLDNAGVRGVYYLCDAREAPGG